MTKNKIELKAYKVLTKEEASDLFLKWNLDSWYMIRNDNWQLEQTVRWTNETVVRGWKSYLKIRRIKIL